MQPNLPFPHCYVWHVSPHSTEEAQASDAIETLSPEEYHEKILNKWVESFELGDNRAKAITIANQLEEAFRRRADTVDLSHVEGLQKIPPLWPDVKALRLPENTSLDKETLQHHFDLILIGWVNEVSIASKESTQREKVAKLIQKAYDDNLSTLKLVDMDYITTLPTLSLRLLDSVSELKLRYFPSLTALPRDLPTGLTSIKLINCKLPQNLHSKWPNNLKEMKLSGCILPKGFHVEWPRNLQKLNLSDCSFPEGFDTEWPSNLRELNLNDCIFPEKFYAQWPSTLQKLFIANCRSLPNTLFETWPPGCQVYGVNLKPEEYWLSCAATPEQEMAKLKEAWRSLEQEENFKSFKFLLSQLTYVMRRVRPEQVVQVIQSVIESPDDIRQQIFKLAEEGTSDCHDRQLLVFHTIECLAAYSRLLRAGADQQAILKLAKGMHMINIIDEAAVHVLHRQMKDKRRTAIHVVNSASHRETTVPNPSEGLEEQIMLRHILGEKLGLPIQVGEPVYHDISQLNESDKIFALEYVNNVMKDQRCLIEGLLSQALWRHFLMRDEAFSAEIQENLKKYHAKLDEIEE